MTAFRGYQENPPQYHCSEKENIQKLWKDMYVGDGKENPSITTRLSTVEAAFERIDKNLNKITWLLIATVFTTVAEIVVKAVK